MSDWANFDKQASGKVRAWSVRLGERFMGARTNICGNRRRREEGRDGGSEAIGLGLVVNGADEPCKFGASGARARVQCLFTCSKCCGECSALDV